MCVCICVRIVRSLVLSYRASRIYIFFIQYFAAVVVHVAIHTGKCRIKSSSTSHTYYVCVCFIYNIHEKCLVPVIFIFNMWDCYEFCINRNRWVCGSVCVCVCQCVFLWMNPTYHLIYLHNNNDSATAPMPYMCSPIIALCKSQVNESMSICYYDTPLYSVHMKPISDQRVDSQIQWYARGRARVCIWECFNIELP